VRIARLVAFICCAVALFASYALLARFVIHGPVTGRSLATSVRRAADSAAGLGDCRRTSGARDWRCTVADPAGSGIASYWVRVRKDSSCWDAHFAVVHSDEGMPPMDMSGCVYRWQWRLL
jgi:hypothetical protein